MLTTVVVIGSLMFLVEGHSNPQFSNIPQSIYWAIVTLTTVGYGDVYPVTPVGKFLSGLVSVAAIGLIALPTGILAAAMSDVMQRRRGPKAD